MERVNDLSGDRHFWAILLFIIDFNTSARSEERAKELLNATN